MPTHPGSANALVSHPRATDALVHNCGPDGFVHGEPLAQRAYAIHAIIDSFSRRILAGCIAGKLSGQSNAEILHEPALRAQGAHADAAVAGTALVVDSGVENLNCRVDDWLERQQRVERILAQIDIKASNSMIETFGHSLESNWFGLHSPTTLADLRRLVAFYAEQHNYHGPIPVALSAEGWVRHRPHSAFQGETPDERYFGKREVVAGLKAAAEAAREARVAANQATTCEVCAPDG